MINRRHIRVKVMQSVYALLQSKSDNLDKEEKFLYASIEKMYHLHVLLLQLLAEVKNIEENHIKIAQKKFLATPEELKPNTKFIDNQVLKIIEESVSLQNFITDNKLKNWQLDDEFVKDIWKNLKESEVYLSYMKEKESTFEKDRTFVLNFYKEIVAPSDKLADYFEGINMSWVDDIPFVNTWNLKVLTNIKSNKPLVLKSLYKDDADKDFVKQLFRKTILHHTKYEQEIVDKTPNWDKDRIAELDMILIKMAICEFLHFPSIPTKVTMNEYIEISKDYSTPKSSFFINGVLDKILKDFNEKKSIQKIGRGLL